MITETNEKVVLLANGQEGLTSIISDYFNKNNYLVDTTNDSNEALIMAKVRSYNLIILDVELKTRDYSTFLTDMRRLNDDVVVVDYTKLGQNIEKMLTSIDNYFSNKIPAIEKV